MTMEKISISELKELQEEYDFKLCKIKGMEIINIRKHENPNTEDISLEKFERILKKRGLAVYKAANDWLKIMRDK